MGVALALYGFTGIRGESLDQSFANVDSLVTHQGKEQLGLSTGMIEYHLSQVSDDARLLSLCQSDNPGDLAQALEQLENLQCLLPDEHNNFQKVIDLVRRLRTSRENITLAAISE